MYPILAASGSPGLWPAAYEAIQETLSSSSPLWQAFVPRSDLGIGLSRISASFTRFEWEAWAPSSSLS